MAEHGSPLRVRSVLVVLVAAGLGFAGSCASHAAGSRAHPSPAHPVGAASRGQPEAVARSPVIVGQPPGARGDGVGHLLVRITHPTPVRAARGRGRVLGTIPPHSPTFDVPTVAWVRRTGPHERWGRVTTPYAAGHPAGWIPLGGLARTSTPFSVRVDLSAHTLTLRRRGREVRSFPTATGGPSTPTPTGAYWVTDRVHYPSAGIYGHFAFGLSAIQTDLPPDWNGGDQIAIHGTPDPASIGTSASSGCLRVSATALSALRPRLRVGTPVVIRA
jgi:lipoprotein-anchoring transpeptidase ErfK/SrfK